MGNSKYFIVSSGRAGSTLLSSILTHAGANFGFPASIEWDVKAGAFEPKETSKASEHAKRAVELKAGSHISRIRMWRRKFHRMKAKRLVRSLLSDIDFVKISNSDVIRLAKAVGYQPSVVLLYRPFNQYVLSSFLRSGRDYQKMMDHYLATYETALVALQIYGGCIISYDEMIDAHQSAWIDRVNEVTGLDRKLIAAARSKLVTEKRSGSGALLPLNPRTDAIHAAIQKKASEMFPPSRLAQRGV